MIFVKNENNEYIYEFGRIKIVIKKINNKWRAEGTRADFLGKRIDLFYHPIVRNSRKEIIAFVNQHEYIKALINSEKLRLNNAEQHNENIT